MDAMFLTKGQKQFLGRKGITAKEWESYTPEVQKEWLKEMAHPEKCDNDFYPNRNFQY